MTDDDDDRPDHVGTETDQTPFDHGCKCDVCIDWRWEVRDALRTGGIGTLTDQQAEVARRILRERYGSQTRLTTF
jgi:hypothetical protein